MLRRLLLSAATVMALSQPVAVSAQEQATLVSDRLEIAGDTRLVAAGHVEVFYKGRRLTASHPPASGTSSTGCCTRSRRG